MIQAMKKYMSQMKNVWAMKRPFCFMWRMLLSPFQTPAKNSAIRRANGKAMSALRFHTPTPTNPKAMAPKAMSLLKSGSTAPSSNWTNAGTRVILPMKQS